MRYRLTEWRYDYEPTDKSYHLMEPIQLGDIELSEDANEDDVFAALQDKEFLLSTIERDEIKVVEHEGEFHVEFQDRTIYTLEPIDELTEDSLLNSAARDLDEDEYQALGGTFDEEA